MSESTSLVDPSRLIVPPEADMEYGAPGGEFILRNRFETRGEPVCAIEANYLADVMGDERDEDAEYVRNRSAIIVDFGGSTGGPAYWRPPYLLIPTSMHYYATDVGDHVPPPDVELWATEVGADCMLAFLPMTDDIPQAVRRRIDEKVAAGLAALLPFPAGRYSVLYEQFEPEHENTAGLSRNIVIRKE